MLLPSTPKQRQKEGSAWTVCVGLTVIEGAEIGHLVQKALLDEVNCRASARMCCAATMTESCQDWKLVPGVVRT